MPESPGQFSTKAEKRESEEKEKRQAAIAKRIEALSTSLDALHSSFSAKSASNNTAYGTLRVKVKVKPNLSLPSAHADRLINSV